ncbi:MAG: 2-succinyl-5-enolpyruvyl-6-hydroxy-3-cyclohexene-1-carboxylic-acid synthase [Planctomycetota bacterium]
MIDAIWTSAAIARCLKHGVDHFFLAPGSRCTPLTLAVAERIDVTVTQHFDERGLAFSALGYGRATGKPGAFICTSGTAVANAYPAVIEAAMEGVPLLLFTADRPDELRGTGANQTIEQREIFGSYPRLFINLPVPTDSQSSDQPSDKDLCDQVSLAIQQATYGPVHINWMFREPFTISEHAHRDAFDLRSGGETESAEFNDATNKTNIAGPSAIEPMELKGNVLIALGSCDRNEAESAWQLAERLKCPLLTDVTSGIGGGSFDLPKQYDLPKPDSVLHLGGRIVSKSWFQWIESIKDSGVHFWHFTPTGQTINPARVQLHQRWTSLTDAVAKITGDASSHGFTESWHQAAKARDAAIGRVLGSEPRLNEPSIAREISRLCPVETGLFLGNSTPIRDMDWYGIRSDEPRLISANRGASGIDGLLATAVGFASGLRKRTTVVVGDLSALHDLNSLSLVSNSPWPITVLVINNHAGHIFDLLPVQASTHFERFFATPHEYDFEHVAKMFRLPYERISERGEFRDAYRRALRTDHSQLIEIMTDRRINVEVRRRIRDEIDSCS